MAFQSNCYLLSTENAAVVIDPGFYSTEVIEFLKNAQNKERIILITHGHVDHIGGALLSKTKTGTKIAIGKKDNVALSDELRNLSAKFQIPLEPFSADILLNDNEIITTMITLGYEAESKPTVKLRKDFDDIISLEKVGNKF